MYKLLGVIAVLTLVKAQSSDEDFADADCPGEVTETMMWPYQFPFGLEDRALRTVPASFSVHTSTVPGAGLGVFAETFIPKYTWLGEYEGMIITEDMDDEELDDRYMWRVDEDDELLYLVDGADPTTSNWLRYVNCARKSTEENVQMLQCHGKIYYMTVEDVAPGQELMIYYGDDYAEELGISPFHDQIFPVI